MVIPPFPPQPEHIQGNNIYGGKILSPKTAKAPSPCSDTQLRRTALGLARKGRATQSHRHGGGEGRQDKGPAKEN